MNGSAKGLKVCAIIWLIIMLLGSTIAAIIIWKESTYYGYYSTRINGTMVAIGFGVLAGGSLVGLTIFFLLSCIASMADSDSVWIDYSDEKAQRVIEKSVSKVLEDKKKLFKNNSPYESDSISDQLPRL